MRGHLRTAVRLATSPLRWVFRIGLGGETRWQKFVRRTWLCLFLLVVVVAPLTWLALAARFRLLSPTDQFNIADSVNATTAKIPQQDRAWPLYEVALQEFEASGDAGVRITNGKTDYFYGQEVGYLLDIPRPKTLDKYRDFTNRHRDTIQHIILASKKPQLGFLFPRNLDDYFDAQNEQSYPLPLPICLDKVVAIPYALRTAFFAAIADRDIPFAIELLEARVRVEYQIRNQAQVPMFCWRRPGMSTLIKDVAFALQTWPHAVSEQQLNQLSSIIQQIHVVEPNYDTTRLFFTNLVDQYYSQDGFFCASGTWRVSDQAHSSTWTPLEARSKRWLCPGRRNTLDDLKARATTDLVLPIAVLFWPSRERMLSELHAICDHREECAALPFREIEQIRRSHRNLSQPAWREIPAWLQGQNLGIRFPPVKPQVEAYQQSVLLFIELEKHRRRTGDWPSSLDECGLKAPEDPFNAGQPMQYQIIDGRPHLWSLDDDFAPDPGSFNARAGDSDSDWLILPVEDSAMGKLWAKQRDEHEARLLEASKSADK